MTKYEVVLTEEEKEILNKLVLKGGKGYKIKRAQVLLKLDKEEKENGWTYAKIRDAYNVTEPTITSIAKNFVFEGLEFTLGRKTQENRHRKVTGEVEARLCAIACSEPPAGTSRWTMQMIADELIRLEVVEYITDSTVCEVMKKTKLSHGK